MNEENVGQPNFGAFMAELFTYIYISLNLLDM